MDSKLVLASAFLVVFAVIGCEDQARSSASIDTAEHSEELRSEVIDPETIDEEPVDERDFEADEDSDASRTATINVGRVRLRASPNLSSSVVRLLREGESVEVDAVSIEVQSISDMLATWYRIETSAGEAGWVYGQFLDYDFDEMQLSVVSITDVNPDALRIVGDAPQQSVQQLISLRVQDLNLDVPVRTISTDAEIDSLIYSRLAGVYLLDEPQVPNVRRALYRTETSWGPDFNFGRGTTLIDYRDGRWSISDQTEIGYFDIKAVDESVVVVDWGPNRTPREETWRISDSSLIGQNGLELFKVSGPDRYLEYLRTLQEYHADRLAPFDLVEPSEAESRLGAMPFEVYRLFKANDMDALSDYISTDLGLTIDYYGANRRFTFSDVKERTSRFASTFDSIHSELTQEYSPDYMESVALFNEYAVSDVAVIQSDFPGAIAVELLYSPDEYIVCVFVQEDASFKLARVIHRALDLA